MVAKVEGMPHSQRGITPRVAWNKEGVHVA